MPLLALLGSLCYLLYRLYNNPPDHLELSYLLLPVMVLVVVLVILHLLIALLLPLRWAAIRGEFQKQLNQRLRQDLEDTYGPAPLDLADKLLSERRLVEKLVADTREVASWLEQREQSASIAGLYGH